jgi:hypothetical protein
MPTLGEVKWGEDNSLDVAPQLTAEEKDLLEKRKAALDKLLARKQLAKYKIELFMNGKERGPNRPYTGMVSFWESGSRLHGGGDDKVYLCPAEGCKGIIGGSSQGYGHLVCPSCMKVWKGTEVIGEKVHKHTTADWAKVIHRYFIHLGFNADIYLKYMRFELRGAASLEQMRQYHGDKLNQIRNSRQYVVYPLRHIIKDTAAGSELLARFRAFLSV